MVVLDTCNRIGATKCRVPIRMAQLQKWTSGKGEQSHASLSARIHSPATGTEPLAIHFPACKTLP